MNPTLRRLCGWSRVSEIPREATFSRAFAEFSQSRLPERMHAALVAETLGDALIGHVSRDPTAIEARETPAPKPKARTPNRKRGRPRKGAERTKEPGRLERQANGMDLDEMLDANLITAEGLRSRGKENCQGGPGGLARLQAAYRHSRLRGAAEDRPHLGIRP